MKRLVARRYALPLREGGSLPAVIDTDDGLFAVKFLGAGQGPKALIAEALAAEIGLLLGLPIPEPAIVEIDAGFGRSESDPEIQDILRWSVGPNFGLRFITGALGFDAAVDTVDIDPQMAARIVWFDAYISNVDRTPRNPNILIQGDQLWLIDHGASLYFHHQWRGWEARVQARFPQIKDHIPLHQAGDLRRADEELRPKISRELLERIVTELPDRWLEGEDEFASLDAHRAAYVTYLLRRLEPPRAWLDEAIAAQNRGPEPYAERITRRVV